MGLPLKLSRFPPLSNCKMETYTIYMIHLRFYILLLGKISQIFRISIGLNNGHFPAIGLYHYCGIGTFETSLLGAFPE